MEVKVEQGIVDGDPECCTTDDMDECAQEFCIERCRQQDYDPIERAEIEMEYDADDEESLDEEVVLLSRHFVQSMFNAWMDENALDLLKKSYERKPAVKRKAVVKK